MGAATQPLRAIPQAVQQQFRQPPATPQQFQQSAVAPQPIRQPAVPQAVAPQQFRQPAIPQGNTPQQIRPAIPSPGQVVPTEEDGSYVHDPTGDAAVSRFQLF